MNIKVKKMVEVEEEVDIGDVPVVYIHEITLIDKPDLRMADVRVRLGKVSHEYSISPGKYALVRID